MRVRKDLKVPDFEALILRRQKMLPTLPETALNELEELRYYLFWFYAERGEVERAQKFRPLSDILPRRAPNDLIFIRRFLEELPDFRVDAVFLDELDWTRKGGGIEQERIEPDKGSPSFSNEPQEDLYSFPNLKWSYSREKPIVLRRSPFEGDQSQKWVLEDRPFLLWQEASASQIHKNELFDLEEGRVVSHVFFIKDLAFEIPFDAEKQDYAPRKLEETLCLLQIFSEAGDLKEQTKWLQACPLMVDKLSEVALKLMQNMLAKFIFKLGGGSFEALGLQMQIVYLFSSWTENPSLNIDQNVRVQAQSTSLALWELYRAVSQNIAQELLLAPPQREVLRARQLEHMQNTFSSLIEGFHVGQPLIWQRRF